MSGIFWNPEVSARSRAPELSTQAVVMDVIRNEEHPEYGRTGFTVGTIRFKYLRFGAHRDSVENAFYARPMEVAVQEYPLIGELVSVQKIGGNHFYSRRLNINNQLGFNSFPNILDTLKPINTQQDTSRSIEQARQNVLHQSTGEPEENLSDINYQSRESLHNLKHFDGDVIFQNRYGATLRFGSSQSENALNQQTQQIDEDTFILGPTKQYANDPIIIMRVGEREDPTKTRNTDYALIMEDINLDSSSFVLSTNQLIEFKFASNDDVYFRSAGALNKNPLIMNNETKLTSLSNNQSLLNSGRVILNAKTENIIFSAQQDLISLTNRDTIFDTGEDYVIGAKQIYLMAEVPLQGPISSESYEGRDPSGTVAIAEMVIEVFKDILDFLHPDVGLAPYKAVGGLVQPSGPMEKMNIYRDLDKIRSKLVRIQK